MKFVLLALIATVSAATDAEAAAAKATAIAKCGTDNASDPTAAAECIKKLETASSAKVLIASAMTFTSMAALL